MTNTNTKIICHITTVHTRRDTRIFHKICKTIVKHKIKVILIVADGKGEKIQNNIRIIDIGKTQYSRLQRMTIIAYKAFKKSNEFRSKLIHFHDPELLPFGIISLLNKKTVIYDAHEDYPRQVLYNDSIPALIRFIFPKVIDTFEKLFLLLGGHIVAATPQIAKKFNYVQTTVVQNYPDLDEIQNKQRNNYRQRFNNIAYVGSISEYRGIFEMVRAMGIIKDKYNAKLLLAGEFSPHKLKDTVKITKGWNSVKYYGWVDRQKFVNILAKSKIGLVLLHPTKNYLHSYPTKLFEFMAAGIPVIASNFPLWKEIIDKARCGIVVDPKNPNDIAKAIQYLLDNPQKAEVMGKCGLETIKHHYNWKNEEMKLLSLYHRLL